MLFSTIINQLGIFPPYPPVDETVLTYTHVYSIVEYSMYAMRMITTVVPNFCFKKLNNKALFPITTI